MDTVASLLEKGRYAEAIAAAQVFEAAIARKAASLRAYELGIRAYQGNLTLTGNQIYANSWSGTAVATGSSGHGRSGSGTTTRASSASRTSGTTTACRSTWRCCWRRG